MIKLRSFLFLLALTVVCVLVHFNAAPVAAQARAPINPEFLAKEIDEFASPPINAKAYIVWQYGGDRGTGLEFDNDDYSFFRGQGLEPAICAVLKEKAAQYPGTAMGVNITNPLEDKFSYAYLDGQFRHLSQDCGVKVIRIFGYKGGIEESGGRVTANAARFQKVLDAANANGIQVLIAIGDYSNGGGFIESSPQWFINGDWNKYLQFAQAVTNVTGNQPGLYGYELANEPHCGGDPNAIGSYIEWVQQAAAILRKGSANVGIGQMASHNETLCDSPGNNDFAKTNAASPNVTMGSGHYYSEPEKINVKAAAAQIPGGRAFYIGEAGWGKDTELTPEDFYLYPIKGLAEGDTQTIVRDLADQGYQVQCTTPKVDIRAVTGGEGWSRFNELISQGVLQPISQSLQASDTLNYTQSTVPLFRDQNLINTLNASLENYWGFQDTRPGSQVEQTINSSAIYSLSSRPQQCTYKVKVLESIEHLCGQLQDPSTCALYRSFDGSGSYDTRTLLEAYRGSGLNCNQIAKGQVPAEQQDMATALMKTPLYLDRAYRLAFLVVSVELKDEPQGLFSLFRRNGTATPRNDVRVVAFKIPDFATNRSLTDSKSFNDTLQLTRNTIIDTGLQQRNRQEDLERRAARAAEVPAGTESVIQCAGEENCEDPLTKGLIQMVNNNGQTCDISADDLKYETADTIKSQGNLTSSEGTLFNDGSDPAQDLFTAPPNQVENPQTAVFNFISTLRLGADGDDTTDMKAYLIYPVGTELTNVENALLSLFDTNWPEQYKVVEAGEGDASIRKYFRLDNIVETFSSGKVTRPVPGVCQVNEEGVTVCQTQDAEGEVGISNQDSLPRILGGRLGFLTRMVQANANALNTRAHAFLQACTRTEDFLLGRCTRFLTEGPVDVEDEDLQPVAQCTGGARITSGDTAKHFCQPNQSCTIAQAEAASCLYFSQAEHDIPDWNNPQDAVRGTLDPALACASLYSFVACTYPDTLIQNRVNDSGQFDVNGGMTACEYILRRVNESNATSAKKVSPRLALAIALEESGLEAFNANGQPIALLGVTSAPRTDLGAQVTGFINTVRNRTGYLEFLRKYSGEVDPDQNRFCANKFFPARVRDYYNYLD